MFDKIPLLMFQWKIPRTPKNKKLFSDFSFSFPKDAMSATDASFSDFALDGTQHFIHLRPISDYTSSLSFILNRNPHISQDGRIILLF